MIRVALATILFLLASSSIEAVTQFSLALRIVGVAIVGLPIIWGRSVRITDRRRLNATVLLLAGLSVGYMFYLTGAMLLHGRPTEFIVRTSAVALAVALAVLLSNYYTPSQVAAGLFGGLATVVGFSMVTVLLGADFAIEQERARGLIENANTLGFAGAILVVVSVILVRRGSVAFLGAALGAFSLVASASRASLLIVAICLVGFALIGVGRARLLVVLGLFAAVVAWAVGVFDLSSLLLFRETNSREGSAEIALEVLRTYPVSGVGFRELNDTSVAGSFFSAAIDAGYFGVVGIVISYVALLVSGMRAGRATVVFTLAVGVYAFLESWLISLSGPIALVVLVVWVAISAHDAEGRAQSESHGEPTNASKLKRPEFVGDS